MAMDVTRHPCEEIVAEEPPSEIEDQGCPNCVHVCHGPESPGIYDVIYPPGPEPATYISYSSSEPIIEYNKS